MCAAAPNKLLFTGENNYLLTQKLKSRKDAFSAKYGSEAIFSLYPGETDITTLQNALLSQGFFTSKTFVIVYDIATSHKNKGLANKTEKIETRLINHRTQIPDTTTLILVSPKPDKRLKTYKFYKNECTPYEFKPLDGRNGPAFLRGLLPSLTRDQAKLMMSLVGNDANSLAGECNKLTHYMEANALSTITDEAIKNVVYNHNLSDNFALLENLMTNPEKCVELLDEARLANADIYQYMGMLYRGFKIIMGMTELYESGVTDSKTIASTLKVHPFAVAKQIKKINTFVSKKDAMKDMYQRLLQIDYESKTGLADSKQLWVYIKHMMNIA